MTPIGETIRSLRRESGLTQVELAKKVKVTANYIATVERGKRSLSPKLLKKMAKVFRTSAHSIVNEGGNLAKTRGLRRPLCEGSGTIFYRS
jgi:transcriptional regulator with XRE-family HTH domain